MSFQPVSVTETTAPILSSLLPSSVTETGGKIVKGTWSCTVEIILSDYKFAGSAVDSTRVVLNNKITVNGGFNA